MKERPPGLNSSEQKISKEIENRIREKEDRHHRLQRIRHKIRTTPEQKRPREKKNRIREKEDPHHRKQRLKHKHRRNLRRTYLLIIIAALVLITVIIADPEQAWITFSTRAITKVLTKVFKLAVVLLVTTLITVIGWLISKTVMIFRKKEH